MLIRDRLMPSLAHQSLNCIKAAATAALFCMKAYVLRGIVLTVVNSVKTFSEAIMLFHVSYLLNRTDYQPADGFQTSGK